MLILASASPRRRELLALITGEFLVQASDVDESLPPGMPPAQAVQELARRKARAVLGEHPGDIVIGSDTVVVLDGEILGKPRDHAHAAGLLRRLSGRRHTVYTGVAVLSGKRRAVFCERAEVEFISLQERQVAAYIATGEPMDKAGAYGIQGKGALFVREICGDYYTVMGLPVCRLAWELEQFGVSVWNL